MKTMVLLFSAISFFGASNALASLRAAHCDTSEKQNTVSTTVLQGDELSVIIAGVNPSTGYTIVSAEGIEGKFWKSTSAVQTGAGGKMTFRIKADHQSQSVATYTFEYKQPWSDEAPASTCLVTVVKK